MSFRTTSSTTQTSIYTPSTTISLTSSSGGVSWISGAFYNLGIGVGLSVLASFLTPLVLGVVTKIRQRLIKEASNVGEHGGTNPANLLSTLLTGRVWHTRFHPKKHAFSYPLFLFAIDLDDEATFNQALWPLSWIMKFSTSNHLINGEGGVNQSDRRRLPLVDRVYALVEERTAGYLRPTADSHRVCLVTHLTYYGYCFNPVSFYYLIHRSTGRMQAVVAEVSNTPWLEQYSYVLHPTSRNDQVRYARIDDTTTNFKFPKHFHVSPFMEMQYLYDWTFAGQDQIFGGQNGDEEMVDTTRVVLPVSSLRVTTALVRPEDGQKQFSATMRVHPVGLDPLVLAWKMAWFPSYCIIIQLWIHYEAFWLFCKGVAYQPHPEGAETTASRIIGTLMTPLFQLHAWWDKLRKGIA